MAELPSVDLWVTERHIFATVRTSAETRTYATGASVPRGRTDLQACETVARSWGLHVVESMVQDGVSFIVYRLDGNTPIDWLLSFFSDPLDTAGARGIG